MKIEDELVVYRQGDCCLCNKNIHHLEIIGKECGDHALFDERRVYSRCF